jgi:TRAP-type C4-dicarboxylate transport system permease small subunit
MAGSVVFEVIMRYFLNRPTRWVLEFSEYMLLYMAFLPGAWVLKREGHVRIDLLLNVFSPKVQTMINTVTSGIGVLLCGLFFWFSATLTWETFQSGEILFRAVHVPKWSVLVAIPIGLLLLTFQFGRRVGLYWRGFGTAQPEKEAGPPETPPAFHVG